MENGKVTFLADAEGICRGNIFLRTTERILLKVAEFKAETFDELFEACKAIPWEHYIPENGKFWVTKATSVNSKLFSPSDIQRIVKKAMVESLKRTYRVSWFAEDGASYPLRINIMKDIVTVSLDTTGVSLHKRGYRRYTAPAPVTETLAAAMLLLSPWKKDRILVDPFCGSGTIPIEAAMIACRIAPGLNREFLSEEWDNLIPKKEWYGVVEEAQNMVCEDAEVQIQGYDIDDEVLKMARANAALAGVEDKISLHIGDAKEYLREQDGKTVYDLVFIDANKREYADYYELALALTRSGGFILADDVLWDGKVFAEHVPEDKQTAGIVRFNELAANDPRVETVIIPVRHGLGIIRKK